VTALKSIELHRTGAADLIAQALREQLVSGELRSGDPLREADLADAFDVSRNTVREALRLLTSAGLAVHEVHRGVAVKRLTVDEVRDLYGLRELCELAGGQRADELDDGELATLRAPLDLAVSAIAAGAGREAMTHDLAFHRAIVALARNRRLDAVFFGVLAELRLGLAMLEPSSLEQWPARNEELYARFAARDTAGVRDRLVPYLARSRDELIGHLQATGTGRDA
jgi:DNA-binding GntR family transcriptional regulator